MGAGKGNTTIISLTDLPCEDLVAIDIIPTLITFHAGFPKISDMTIEIANSPCQLYALPFDPGNEIQDLVVTLAIAPHAIDESSFCTNVPVVEEGNSMIDNVEFNDPGQVDVYNQISIGAYTNYLIPDCIGWFKTLKGTHTITNCDFNGGFVGVNTYILKDSKVTIGGSPKNGNNFNSLVAMDAYDNDNTSIEFSHNKMKSELYSIEVLGGTSWAWEGIEYHPLASYHIQHNEIMAKGDAIITEDFDLFGDHKSLDVVIEQNKFILDESYGAINGWYAQDVLIRNNNFSGTSNMGIYLGYNDLTCSNWTILGNNFNNLTTSLTSPVYLGPDAENCTVVGGKNKVNVLDEGTNNILTGVNHQGNPLGPKIREAMEARRDLLKLKRR